MQKIQLGQGSREGVINRGNVVLGQLKKESELLDANGNVIDPRTKQIIKKREQEEIV